MKTSKQPATLLEELRAEHEKRQSVRVNLEADLVAARERLAEAEAATLTAADDELPNVINRRRNERDLIDVLEVRIARAEEARQKAAEAASAEGLRLARERAEASIREHQAKIDAATEAVFQKWGDFLAVLEERELVLEAAQRENEIAAGYGVPVAQGVSNRDVLGEIGRRSGIRVEVAPALRVVA